MDVGNGPKEGELTGGQTTQGLLSGSRQGEMEASAGQQQWEWRGKASCARSLVG